MKSLKSKSGKSWNQSVRSKSSKPNIQKSGVEIRLDAIELYVKESESLFSSMVNQIVEIKSSISNLKIEMSEIKSQISNVQNEMFKTKSSKPNVENEYSTSNYFHRYKPGQHIPK